MIVTKIEQLSEAYGLLKDSPELYFDTETNGLDYFLNEILLIGINQVIIDRGAMINSLITSGIHKTQSTDIIGRAIQKFIISLIDKLWIAHNIKFDYQFLKTNFNVELVNMYCTLVGSNIIYNGYTFKHTLENLVILHNIPIEMDKSGRNEFIGKKLGEPISKEGYEYLFKDCLALKPIYAKQQMNIDNLGMQYLFKFEQRLPKIVGNAEVFGLGVDKEQWLSDIPEHEAIMNRTDRIIKWTVWRIHKQYNKVLSEPFTKPKNKKQKELLNNPINILEHQFSSSSPHHLKAVFHRAGIDISGTGEDVLEDFIRNNEESLFTYLAEQVLIFRNSYTAISKYGSEWLVKYLHPMTGKVHTTLNQVFTDTGRFSCSNPNMQNIPRNNSKRKAFVAPEGYLYFTGDYSGQEAYIAAIFSQDPLLLNAVLNDVDIHSLLATDTYNIIYNELGYIPKHGDLKSSKDVVIDLVKNIIVSKSCNKVLRNNHKNQLFAYFYAAGIARTQALFNINKEVAKKVYAKLQENLPVLTAYQKKIRNAVKKMQVPIVIANTRTNRRKTFHEYQTGKKEMYKVEKESCNFPIQATGADLIKESIVAIEDYIINSGLREKYPLTGFAWTVHDEVIYAIPDCEESEQIAKDIANIMEETSALYLNGTKIGVDYHVLKTWIK